MSMPANVFADPAADKPPRPRRWIPLSLRIFAVLLVLIGLSRATWIGIRTQRQLAAIREIERLGGAIDTRNTAPTWLKGLIGDGPTKLFDVAFGLAISEANIQDTDLRHLAQLPELESVVLNNETQTTDAALVYIEGLTRIEVLLIWNASLTDDALAHLRGLNRLKEIDIESPHITDAGLEHLKSLPRITRLILRKTKVTHAGVDKLKRVLPNLDVTVLSAGYN
jgi:hypothetical protein